MPNANPKFEKRGAFADRPSSALDALMPNQLPAGVEDLANARTIKVDLLESNPYQPRQTFDQAALDELAADIAAHGVLQPLLVRPHPTTPGHYQIVAGERRWRAAQRAGLDAVPCVERTMDDSEMERLALMENIQRADLDPLDEAHSFQRLMERFDVSLRDLAVSVHKHHEYIAQRLRLIKDPRIEALVRDDKMKPSTAQELARVKDERQRDAFIARAEQGERIPVQDVRAAQGAKRPATQPKVSKVSTDAGDTPPERVPVALSTLASASAVRSDAGQVDMLTPEQRAQLDRGFVGSRLASTHTAIRHLEQLDKAEVAAVLNDDDRAQWALYVAVVEQHLAYVKAVLAEGEASDS